MRVMRTKAGQVFIETTRNVQEHQDVDGSKTFFLMLPSFEEIVKLTPSPILEDAWAVVDAELKRRDSGSIPDVL